MNCLVGYTCFTNILDLVIIKFDTFGLALCSGQWTIVWMCILFAVVGDNMVYELDLRFIFFR